MDNTVILGSARTAIGRMQGALATLPASDLGAAAIQGALKYNKIPSNSVDEVFMGCVLTAGQGQAPARQAALKAGLPEHVPATTINKMCGSGMQAVILGHHHLHAYPNQVVVAGGQENMSRAPYLMQKARQGYKLGHDTLFDHLYLDGLEDAYQPQLMGVFADDTAKKFNISRSQQDEFAALSHQRALSAQQKKRFAAEITAVKTTAPKKGTVWFDQDECPRTVDVTKIAQLNPVFTDKGTVTAANASAIADGAAALILSTHSYAKTRGYRPLARIVATATHAQAPRWFTTAPSEAIKKVLQRCAWDIQDVDLFEINEAFAVVSLATMQTLNISHDKVNSYGGACALGHPIGASGARILVTLINALIQSKQQRGIASLCLGGGEATAIAIERI